MPPEMTFKSEMWHPNVYEDGKVCISILHPPGEDQFNSQETAEERWRPILGVEQIIVSVMSMLSDPNGESPANIDAGVQFRDDRAAFKKRVRQVSPCAHFGDAAACRFIYPLLSHTSRLLLAHFSCSSGGPEESRRYVGRQGIYLLPSNATCGRLPQILADSQGKQRHRKKRKWEVGRGGWEMGGALYSYSALCGRNSSVATNFRPFRISGIDP